MRQNGPLEDELGVHLELGRGKRCKVANEGPVWEDCGIKWWATSSKPRAKEAIRDLRVR